MGLCLKTQLPLLNISKSGKKISGEVEYFYDKAK